MAPLSPPEFSPAMNANRSQSTCERVSVRGDKICRERVCASQRPGGVLAPAIRPLHRRDANRRSGLRECRGKPGVLSETAGNRICAGLGGGRTRTRTLDPLIKSRCRPTSVSFDSLRRSPSRLLLIGIILHGAFPHGTLSFARFRLLLLTLRFPGQLRPNPWPSKN